MLLEFQEQFENIRMYLRFSALRFSGNDNMASLVCGYCNIEVHIAMCMVKKYRMRIL